jgi:hypothetical protein
VVTEPPVPDQVTDVFVEPVTVAVNCCVVPATRVTVEGLMEIETGALTVTVADADFVESATLVAFTVYVPGVLGAV